MCVCLAYCGLSFFDTTSTTSVNSITTPSTHNLYNTLQDNHCSRGLSHPVAPNFPPPTHIMYTNQPSRVIRHFEAIILISGHHTGVVRYTTIYRSLFRPSWPLLTHPKSGIVTLHRDTRGHNLWNSLCRSTTRNFAGRVRLRQQCKFGETKDVLSAIMLICRQVYGTHNSSR